jgi:hypothetical protein
MACIRSWSTPQFISLDWASSSLAHSVTSLAWLCWVLKDSLRSFTLFSNLQVFTCSSRKKNIYGHYHDHQALQEPYRSRTTFLPFSLVSKSSTFSVIFNKDSKASFFFCSVAALCRSSLLIWERRIQRVSSCCFHAASHLASFLACSSFSLVSSASIS